MDALGILEVGDRVRVLENPFPDDDPNYPEGWVGRIVEIIPTDRWPICKVLLDGDIRPTVLDYDALEAEEC